MNYIETIWKPLIEETLKKLSIYPIKIDRIYDKYSSLRIDYHNIDPNTFTKEMEDEIERIILDAEEKSEIHVFEEKNKKKPPKIEKFTIDNDKTFFGLKVYPYGVNENEIKELPFYKVWEEKYTDIDRNIFNGKTYININDWEKFCREFILGTWKN